MTPTYIRVLCVDDHRLVRKGVARLIDLEPDMRVVAEASSGAEAVAQFTKHTPDVTLMDLELPGMEGVEAISAIRKTQPDARIVVLTMYDGDEDIHRAIQAGAAAYLLKDTVPEELAKVIRDVHAGRQVFPPRIRAVIRRHAGQPALTSRELEVLELLAAGNSTNEIARALGVTKDTAKAHIKNIYSKFELHGRTALVTEAVRRGFIRRERNSQVP